MIAVRIIAAALGCRAWERSIAAAQARATLAVTSDQWTAIRIGVAAAMRLRRARRSAITLPVYSDMTRRVEAMRLVGGTEKAGAAHAHPSRVTRASPPALAVPAPTSTPRPAVSAADPLGGIAAGPREPAGRVDLIDWSEHGATLVICADRIRISAAEAERLYDLLYGYTYERGEMLAGRDSAQSSDGRPF